MGIASRIVKKTAKKPLTKKQIQAKTAEEFYGPFIEDIFGK